MLGNGKLNIAGASLEYRMVRPSPDKAPTIVLLHEGLGCVALWKDFPDQLAALTGCRVFVYSRRGYGNSSPYPPPWSQFYMHDEANILAEVLTQLDIQSAIICGHSDGASIAAICQGTTPHPKVLGLVLIAPHFFAEPVGLAAIRQTVNHFNTGDLRTRLEVYHKDNIDNAFLGWSGTWLHDSFVDWNIEYILPNITAPVLVVQGDQDPYGTMAQVDTVRKNAGGYTEITILDNCGHAPHLEQTKAVLGEIGQFVSKILNR